MKSSCIVLFTVFVVANVFATTPQLDEDHAYVFVFFDSFESTKTFQFEKYFEKSECVRLLNDFAIRIDKKTKMPLSCVQDITKDGVLIRVPPGRHSVSLVCSVDQQHEIKFKKGHGHNSILTRNGGSVLQKTRLPLPHSFYIRKSQVLLLFLAPSVTEEKTEGTLQHYFDLVELHFMNKTIKSVREMNDALHDHPFRLIIENEQDVTDAVRADK